MLLENYCLLDHRSAANFVALRRAGTTIISGRPGSAATFRPRSGVLDEEPGRPMQEDLHQVQSGLA